MRHYKEEKAGAPEGAPACCPECKRPLDDIEGLDKSALLDAIELGLLRDLARSVRSGNANHQELAIARGLLRDNKRTVPVPEEMDETLPPQAAPRKFPSYEHDE